MVLRSDITNGAQTSIPSWAWSFVGAPWNGRYIDAAIIHDYGCVYHPTTWETVHYRFYLGMRARDVAPLKAKIMYAAVYHRGPRWPQPGQPVSPPTLLDADLPRLQRLIETRENGLAMETAAQAQTRANGLVRSAETAISVRRDVESEEASRYKTMAAEVAERRTELLATSDQAPDLRARLQALLKQLESDTASTEQRLSSTRTAVASAAVELENARALALNPIPAPLPPMSLAEIHSLRSGDLATIN
ncbi:MAG: DUF1353 domain-containing protein [Acidobacteria bacterium]|nr:DUF1353 domain-containing protein [Acidobacteriota bacterium]